jgi:hypothetical protein
MFVTDYAQGEDLKTNYAISGYKETLIRGFCKSANFNFNDTYRTCVIKDDLPALDGTKITKKQFNNESEYARLFVDKVVPQYAEILKAEIETLQPNLIVPLGEIGFQHLSGLAGIRKFRGSVLKLSPAMGIERYTKLLPILGPHPYLNADHKQKFITQLDFAKIPKWSNDAPIPDDVYQIWVCRTSSALRNFISRSYPLCADKGIEQGGYLVFDIETFLNIPTCISFCFDGFESCCVPLLDQSIDLDQRVLMVEQIAKLLNSPIPKVNQNIKYDWKTLERWGFRVSNVVGDTMLAASTLYCEFPKNLGFLTSIYTDLPYFKDEGRQYDPAKHKREQFYLYNAKDSLATHQIYIKQIPETIELGVTPVYNKLIQLVPIYRKMEDRGIRIDGAARDRLNARYGSLYRIHCLTLERLLNSDYLNPLSAPAMNRLVFEELGYKKIRGVKGTDEESLNMLMAFGEAEHATKSTSKSILQEIIFCRKIHKVIEIANLDLYPDERFRCEFNLAGTETGRTSAGKTTDYFLKEHTTKTAQKVRQINLGHSLQTIGKHGFWIEGELLGTDIRDMFVPSFGYSFVEVDLSGAEARVDRVLSGNFDMGVFDDPGIHKLTGSWVFNCAPSEIVKNTLRYHLAKTVRHAGERNMKTDRFFLMAQDEGTGVNLTLPEAKRILEDFHRYQPEIQGVYHRDIKTHILNEHALVAPNGRRRDFFDRLDHSAFNQGISWYPQAVVSDQTKFSFIPTFAECGEWAFLLCEAHDGSLAEVPIGKEPSYFKVYKENIETPIDFRQGSLKRDYQLTIPCEAASGDSWGNLKDLTL